MAIKTFGIDTDAVDENVYLAAESDLATVLGHVTDVDPTLLIVDSVQTMIATDADGVHGGVTQIRAVTTALVSLAKNTGVAVVLVGHVTKDGAIAGPRVLEHVVDTVLAFEGGVEVSARPSDAIALALRAPWPGRTQAFHATVAGAFLHGGYLGPVYWAVAHGMPAGVSALIVDNEAATGTPAAR